MSAQGLRIGLAVSRYHGDVTSSMRDAALQTFMDAGGRSDDLALVETPGSFELTAACRAMVWNDDDEFAGRKNFDALVVIGCIIAGETTHDRYLAESLVHGLTLITVHTGVPIGFGVLTCQSLEQARARSMNAAEHGMINKGVEAMQAAIEMACAIRTLRQPMGSGEID